MSLATLLLGLGLVLFFVVAILYVYFALALMAIAKRTKTSQPWLAWIPIGNVYLMTKIAKIPSWVTISPLLLLIPAVGSALFLIVFAWMWWKIAEVRGRQGWWGIVIAVVPIVNLVLLGILAWGKK